MEIVTFLEMKWNHHKSVQQHMVQYTKSYIVI